MVMLMPVTNRFQQYLAALKGRFTKLTRLEFLQPNGAVAYALDNNPYNRRSRNLIQDGSLSVNLQNGQRRTATVKLSNIDGEYDYNVNKVWFGQQIRLSMGLVLDDGTDYYISQGVFYVKDPTEVYNPSENTMTYNLVDKWSYLDGTLFGNLPGIYEIPAKSNVFNAIAGILKEDRGNGEYIDNVPPIFTPYYNGKSATQPDGTSLSLLSVPYTVRSDAQSYGTLLLELADIISAWIGYDATGALRIDPTQEDILDIQKTVLWEFSPTETQFLGATYTTQNANVYNDILVRGEGLNTYEQVAARVVNKDPKSDTNINIIGRKVLVKDMSSYYTNKQCQDMAIYTLKRNSSVRKSITILSSQMFHLMENNIVTIRRPDKDNTLERHLVTGFTVPLSSTGEMTINATSVQDYPNYTVVSTT